jgi:hypothetical protein
MEAICATLSLGFAIATGVFIAVRFGNATTGELTCTYIAGGAFEIVGVLVTLKDVVDVSWTGKILTTRWAGWRGPAFLIGGILLGLLATIAWLHMPPASPTPAAR